jgi:pimeloyl-ACP methyl ester carboxylesterase
MILERHNLQYKGANNKLSLYDVIYPSSDAKSPLILFCHGFKGFKDWGHWSKIFHQFAQEGYAVVKFNFSHSGVGLNSVQEFTDLEAFGENNYLKELEDITLLMDHIQKDVFLNEVAYTQKIHLIGHSRGGSIALLKTSTDKRIKSLTTWSAVADLEERLPKGEELEKWKAKGVRYILNGRTGQKMPMNYQFVESFQNNKKQLNIEKASKKLLVPQLIIHGESDPTVGLEHAYALQVWNSSAQLECIPNADHVFNGKHPFEAKELPKESKKLVELTLEFLKRNS